MMGLMATSSKTVYAIPRSTAPRAPAEATADLYLHKRHSETVQPQSLHVARVFCALQESVSPVLCKFWQLHGGLMAISSKRAYAIPRSTAPRAPAAVHC